MDNESFSKGFLSILGGKVGVTLLGIIITPILVRVLGSSGYGDYAFVMSIYGILTVLYDLGLFDGARKFIAEDKKSDTWVSEIASTSYALGLIMVVGWTTLLAVLLMLNPVRNLLGENMVFYFFLLLFVLGSNQLFRISRSVLFGLGLEQKVEPLNIVYKLVFGVVGISLAYIGFGISGVLVGSGIVWLLVGLISFRTVLSRVKVKLFTGIKKHWKKLTVFGLYSVVNIVLAQALYQTDIIMVRSFLSSTETGYYKAALKTSQYIWFIPNALQAILLHSSSKMWAKNTSSQISGFTSKIVKYTAILISIMAIGIFVLAGPFLEIYYGTEFGVAQTSLRLLLPGVFGFSIARIIVPVIQGKGRLKIITKIMLFVAGTNITLNFFLIRPYGIIGAAIATSISYGMMILMFGIAARKIGFDPFQKVRWIRLLFPAIFTLVVSYAASLIISTPILELFIITPLALFIFSILVLRFKIISIEEIEEIIDNLPSSIGKKLFNILDKIRPLLELFSG